LRPSGKSQILPPQVRKHPTISTGILELDHVLLGGFHKDSLIHFYGGPGSGKTTFTMQVVKNIMQKGWKAIWVDCNGAFSIPKLQRILKDDLLLNKFIMVRPQSFHHQTEIIQQIKLYLEHVAVVVVDPITHFYRAERFQEGSQGFFQELIETQLGTLIGIAHLQKIPVIVINYSTINHEKRLVPLVATGFQRLEGYRFRFKNSQSLQEGDDFSKKELLIESAPDTFSQNRAFKFEITQEGIEEFKQVNIEEAGKSL